MKTKTAEEREQTAAMIGRCETCNGLVYAAVDDESTDRKTLAKEIAGLIRKGRIVSRGTCAEVRAAKWCKCP